MRRLSALLLLLPAAVAGQDRPPPTVLPGGSAVDLTRLAFGRYMVRVFHVTPDGPREASSYTEELIRLQDGRGTAIVNIQASLDGSGVDSVAVDPRSLSPLWERARNPNSWTRLDYHHGRVEGVLSRGGTDQAVDMAVPEAFPISIGRFLIGTLPLRSGYAARVPLFHPRSGLQWLDIEVTGEGMHEGRAVWKVTTRGDQMEQLMTIDKADGEVLVTDLTARGMTMRITRTRLGDGTHDS